MADPYRLAETNPARPGQTGHPPSSAPRDDTRGRRHLGEYDSRSRTTVTPLLLMKSLDRIEGLMRAGTTEAFQSAQQELRAMAKIMRHGAARTDREASRRQKLLELLDLIERRVSGIAAKRASAAEGFTPFKAATTRRAAGAIEAFVAPVQAHASLKTGENDSSRERPINIELTQQLADDSAYVPFEMEVPAEPLSTAGEEVRRHIHAPAKAMPKTSHSVADRMAASATLPILAELTEEERLALFT